MPENCYLMRLISWNINGIRAAFRKGSLDKIKHLCPDVVCVQELKAQKHQIGEGFDVPSGYNAHWSFAERKGYSGVATFTKQKPLSFQEGFGYDEFDSEGRTVITEFKDFSLYNIYFPNGQSNSDRLDYKLTFYNTFLNYCTKELQNSWSKKWDLGILYFAQSKAKKLLVLRRWPNLSNVYVKHQSNLSHIMLTETIFLTG